ncbi:MAG: hypothetical protein VYB54_04720 [Pseudomonadota bacterium]|nr:hypothetical protein [Pseudomonadota bacterium]
MARIRTIKPDFFRHEGLFDLEQETGLPVRLAFAGLWTVADKKGRFEWRPRRIKTEVMPYDDVDFSRVLDALATRGYVVRYSVDGVEYAYIPSWERHQAINNRERDSDLPSPSEDVDCKEELTRHPRVERASSTRQCNYQGEGEGEGGSVSSDTGVPPDRLKILFDLVPDLSQATGQKPDRLRPQLGRWLKQARDDPDPVIEAVQTSLSKADPVSWINAALKPKRRDGWGPSHPDYRRYQDALNSGDAVAAQRIREAAS